MKTKELLMACITSLSLNSAFATIPSTNHLSVAHTIRRKENSNKITEVSNFALEEINAASKGKYLAHYGWNDYSQCIVDKAVTKTGYTWSLADKTKNPKDRYAFNVNGTLKCGKYYD